MKRDFKFVLQKIFALVFMSQFEVDYKFYAE